MEPANEQSIPLGKALFNILACSNEDFTKAISSGEQNEGGAVGQSIHSIETLLNETRTPLGATGALHSICAPCFERVLEKGTRKAKATRSRCLGLLLHIMNTVSADWCATYLSARLDEGSKSEKLAILILICHMSDNDSSAVLSDSMNTVVAQVQKCMGDYSIPTRGTVAATDAVLAMASCRERNKPLAVVDAHAMDPVLWACQLIELWMATEKPLVAAVARSLSQLIVARIDAGGPALSGRDFSNLLGLVREDADVSRAQIIPKARSLLDSLDTSPSPQEAYLRLLGVACVLGKTRLEKLKSLLQDDGAALVPPLASAVAALPTGWQGIGPHLMKVVVAACAGNGTRGEHGAALLSMLDSTDDSEGLASSEKITLEPSLAVGTVAFLAEWICSGSWDVMDMVLKRLDAENKQTQSNAAAVVEEVVRIIAAPMEPGATDSENDVVPPQVILEKICAVLMTKIEDTPLQIRLRSSVLFGGLHPSFIVPRLLYIISSQREFSADARSSAANQLYLYLSEGKYKPADVIEVLLDSVRNAHLVSPMNRVRSGAPVHPGQIESPTKKKPGEGNIGEQGMSAEDIAQRAFPVLGRWVDFMIARTGAAANGGAAVVRLALIKMFASPQNTVMVTFMGKISQLLSKHVVDVVFPLLEDRMSNQSRLTADILEDDSSESSRTVQELLFERLSPLLVLRVMPMQSFQHMESSLPIRVILPLLQERVLSNLEFEEVRKLSAEAIARSPPGVWAPWCFEQVQGIHEDMQVDVVTARMLMLILFHGALIHKSVFIRDWKNDMLKWAKSFLRLAFHSKQPDMLEYLKQLHMVCIDCVAVLITDAWEDATVPSLHTAPLVEEIDPYAITKETLCSGDSVTAEVLTSLEDGSRRGDPAEISYCICMANVLLKCSQVLQKDALTAMVMGTGILPRCVVLVRRVQILVEVRHAALQVLFAMVHATHEVAARSTGLELAVCCLEALRSEAPTIRHGGLKLLGALVYSGEDEDSVALGILGDGEAAKTLPDLQRGIAAVIASEPDGDIRKLAEGLRPILSGRH